MPLTTDKARMTRTRANNAYQAANAVQFYAGSFVGLDVSTGRAVLWSDTANLRWLGMALRKVKGDTTATPIPEVEVNESGAILEKVSVTGVTGIGDQGAPVYATDDDTLTLTPTVNVKAVGRIVRFISGTSVDVELLTPAEYAALNYETYVYHKQAGDSAAGTATAEQVVFSANVRGAVTGITIQPAGALTADGTNNATFTFARRNADGTGKATIVSVATTATGTGSWTAFDDIVLSGLSNTALTPGQKVTLEITKAGTGVVVPIAAFEIKFLSNI